MYTDILPLHKYATPEKVFITHNTDQLSASNTCDLHNETGFFFFRPSKGRTENDVSMLVCFQVSCLNILVCLSSVANVLLALISAVLDTNPVHIILCVVINGGGVSKLSWNTKLHFLFPHHAMPEFMNVW